MLNDIYIPPEMVRGDKRIFKGPKAPPPPPPPAPPARAGDEVAGAKRGSPARQAKLKARARGGIRSTIFAGADQPTGGGFSAIRRTLG